ncbi:MAG: hypothetical protein SFU53_06535 [Terrimicrobiaceae bacterium]|nr:hypothetical protein [Terrimicrobiaceae bacterium]
MRRIGFSAGWTRAAGAAAVAWCLTAEAQIPDPVPAASPATNSAPAATAPTPAPAVQPNVLDGLETLSLSPEPLGPDMLAGPLSPSRSVAPSAPADLGFAGLPAPTLGGEAVIGSIDGVIRQSAPAPVLQAPEVSGDLFAPPIGSSASMDAFPVQSSEKRPMAPLGPPGFFNAKRSIPIGTGRVRYGADVSASLAYNNNVMGTANNPQGDVIFALQPTIYLETGRKANVRFLWAPSFLRYARFKQYDAVNQTFLFSSRYRFSKLRLGMDASYITQSGLFFNSQGQARQASLFARLFAEYPLTRKLNWTFSAEGNATDSDPGGTQFQAMLKSGIDYRYSSKTQFGAALEIGQQSGPGNLTTFQAFLLRVIYNPTARLTISGEGGIQFRQSRSTSAGSSSTSSTVLNALLSYRATDKTAFAMRFSRSVNVDAFAPDNIQTVTTVEASLLWEISRRAQFRASLLGGYVEQESLGGLAEGSYYFAQGSVSLNYLLSNGVSVQVFNTFQQRLRDTQGGNYLSNTSGMSMGMRF